jgi:hypothetical protein
MEEMAHLRDLIREEDPAGLEKAFGTARAVRRSLGLENDKPLP